jgi:hypothetical protein
MSNFTKKTIVTFQDSWLWFLILAFIAAVSFQALNYGIRHGLDKDGILALGIVDAVFLFIIGFRYIMRGIFIETWNNAYHTELGNAIIYSNGVVPNVTNAQIDSALLDAVNFWDAKALAGASYLPGTAKTQVVNNYLGHAFDGGTIGITNKVIVVGNASWTVKALGIVNDNDISIDNQGGADQTLLLIRHEASHICLSALGIDPGSYGNAHHEIFAKAGLGA